MTQQADDAGTAGGQASLPSGHQPRPRWARRRSASKDRDHTAARVVAGGATLTAAVLLLLAEGWYRGVEAALAGRAMSGLLGFPVMVSRPLRTVFFAFDGTGPAHMLGLQVTLGCSSDLLLAAVLLFSGVMLLFGGGSAARVLFAATVAAAVVVFANTLRLVLIALLVDWWGVETGFGWGHTLFGSLITLAAMALALTVFVLVLGRGRGGAAETV